MSEARFAMQKISRSTAISGSRAVWQPQGPRLS